MILRLVWRSLAQRPGRSLLLLLGYALGVGVTIALLSIGDALVDQSKDRDLIGGGDLVILPAGIDLETLKTGGVSSLYFTVDQADYFYREVLTSPRFAGQVEVAAPWIDDELLYMRIGDSVVAVSSAGQIPSRAAALGVSPMLVSGKWTDTRGDRRWLEPSDSALMAAIDRWHRPTGDAARDTTWAEWLYFNVLAPDGTEWIYLTYLIGGAVEEGRWGGRLLATLATVQGTRDYVADVGPEAIDFSLSSPDVRLGDSEVRLGGAGRYRLLARAAAISAPHEVLELELELTPDRRRYLPPVDVSPGDFPSGYVVPVLSGRATGRVCAGRRCREWVDAPAYHDHNWGTWAEVTWDWGQAILGGLSLLYGGVGGPDAESASEPGARFLFAVDEAGLRAVLPIEEIAYRWTGGSGGRRLPESFMLRASRDEERIELAVDVSHARATVRRSAGAAGDRFIQMRGEARLEGRLLGDTVSLAGEGSFETWWRVPRD
jgi:hypothetical protein